MGGTVLAAGAVVRDASGRLLVVRRANPPAAGRWSLPGGRVEHGETPTEAAVRELREETGIDARAVHELGVITQPRDELDPDAGAFEIHAVELQITGGDLRAGDDADELRWVTRAELEALATTAGLLDFLDAHDIAPR